jgi:hypothetical protein
MTINGCPLMVDCLATGVWLFMDGKPPDGNQFNIDRLPGKASKAAVNP